MSKIFEREDRYLVFKASDLTSGQIMILTAWNETVKAKRLEKGKDALTVVVVESDWPEYETVWKMIQDRTDISGQGVTPRHYQFNIKEDATMLEIIDILQNMFPIGGATAGFYDSLYRDTKRHLRQMSVDEINKIPEHSRPK